MAAISPLSSNFCTANYECFQRLIQEGLGNNTVIKSWQVFNRCIPAGSSLEKQSGDRLDHELTWLPADNRALQQFMIKSHVQVVRFRKAPPEGDPFIQSETEQIKDEMLELPDSSELKQRLIQELIMNDPITKKDLLQRPEHLREVLAQIATLSKPVRNQEELDEKEDSIRAKIFSLPFSSRVLQNELKAFRSMFERDVANRLSEFQKACDFFLTPDPEEYPGGDTPLEHRVTLTYAHQAQIGALTTISYHRIFTKQSELVQLEIEKSSNKS